VEISVKLFGGLRSYLPPNSSFNGCRVSIDDDANLTTLLQQLPIPGDKPYLVIVNDEKVAKENYDTILIDASDDVVLLPPIKGG
jgi:sulfur carrier protein ThiS